MGHLVSSGCPLFPQLLDVFSSSKNLNLVLEYLDSDLEKIIKDRSLVFLPADIKSWMAMTFRGLEFCHRNWVLHRVTFVLVALIRHSEIVVIYLGSQTKQLTHSFRWPAQDSRLRSRPRLRRSWP